MTTAIRSGGLLVPPSPGGLACLTLAMLGTLAALALWVSSTWVSAALGIAVLGFLLAQFPRGYVYFYLLISLTPVSVLQALDDFRLLGGADETMQLQGSSLNLVGVAWILNIVLFAAYTLGKRENWWRLRFFRPMILLIALALLRIPFAPNPVLGLRDWVHLTSPVCLCLLCFSAIRSSARAAQTLHHVFLIFSLVLGVAGYQWLTGGGSYDVVAGTYRLSGIYGEGVEVDSATLLLYLACVATPLVMELGLRSRPLTLITCAGSGILLLVSESRAPLIAFLGAGLVMLSKSRAKLKYASLLLLLLCATQLSPRVYARFGGPLLTGQAKFWKNQDMSVNAVQRMATWAMLAHELLDARTILVGRGFGFVDDYLLNVLDDPAELYARVVHNDYLRLLVDLGLAGSLLLLGQLAILYRSGSRAFFTGKYRAGPRSPEQDPLARSLGVGLCSIVVGFAVVAATVNMYTTAQYAVFWILLGILLSPAHWAPSSSPSAPLRDGRNRECLPGEFLP